MKNPSATSTVRLSLIQATALISAAVVLGSQALMQSLDRFWSDSEIWAVSSSRWFLEQWNHFDFGMKPLFHAALWLSAEVTQALGPEALTIEHFMDSARILMAINAFFILISLFWISLRLFSVLAASLTVALVLLNPVYLDHLTSVRSDFLALPWVLWAMYFAETRKLLGLLLTAAAAFFITPKAGLFVFAYAAFFVYDLAALKMIAHQVWTQHRRRAAHLPTFLVALTLLTLLIVQSTSLQQAWLHFTNEAKLEQMGIPYFSTTRWIYASEAFLQSPTFWMLVLTLIPAGLFLHYRSKNILFRFSLFSSTCLILLALNPSKLPFLIASYIPLFAITLSPLLIRAIETLPRLKPLTLIFVISLSLYVGLMHQWRTLIDPESKNADQRILVRDLETYIESLKIQGQPLSMYDGLGLGVHLPVLPYYIGPGQREANLAFPKFLEDHQFSVILGTQKVGMLQDLTVQKFQQDYIPDTWGFYRKSASFQTDPEGRIQAAEFFRALRQKFAWDLGAKAKVYLYLENNWQQEVSTQLPSSLQDWPTDPNVFLQLPQAGQYRVTLFPPFQSLEPKSFEQVFRFRRFAPKSQP